MDELESIETSEEETINVETTTENNEEDEVAWTEEVTYEQAMKWKEDLRKASRKIAELKKQTPKKEASTDTELRFFFIENPEYKEHKEWILEVLSNPKYKDLTPDEALAIYKLKAPKESQTVIKNTIWGAYKPKPKTLWEMDEKEAVNLPPNEYIKYLKAKWELK